MGPRRNFPACRPLGRAASAGAVLTGGRYAFPPRHSTRYSRMTKSMTRARVNCPLSSRRQWKTQHRVTTLNNHRRSNHPRKTATRNPVHQSTLRSPAHHPLVLRTLRSRLLLSHQSLAHQHRPHPSSPIHRAALFPAPALFPPCTHLDRHVPSSLTPAIPPPRPTSP